MGCVEGRIPKIVDMPSIGQPAEGPSPRRLLRSFSPEYKLAIVAEYENAPNEEKIAILRREGLYSSQVIERTRACAAGPSGGRWPLRVATVGVGERGFVI